MNRSGKSELVRFLVAKLACRRVLIDPKGEWVIPGSPVHQLRARDAAAAEREVAAIDWQAPFIHVQPAHLERPQLDALFDRIAQIPGDLTVWIDECYGVSTGSYAPRGLRQLLTAGAGLGRGVFACTQRPRNIETTFKSEADHLFLFPPLSDDDTKEAVSCFPFLPAAKVPELAATLPEHGYIWANKRDRRIDVGDPLPPEYLAYNTAAVRKR
jgi:hypothetical protein